MKNLTVVVTNFKRPGFLSRCLDSVAAAGVQNVVISSFCPDPETQEIINKFSERTDVRVEVTTLPEDIGCNELWLRGVYYATTKYVLILHDDDFLDPSFGRTYRNTIAPALQGGCGFASWRGARAMPDGTIEGFEYFQGPTRRLSTAAMVQYLMNRMPLSLSPVLSVFRRHDAIQILKEAAQFLSRYPECHTRATMMVGNDLLLYLRNAEKYNQWLYVDEVLSYFGVHKESETVSHQDNPLPLMRAYQKAREHFNAYPGISFKPETRLWHVWSDFQPSKQEDAERIAWAQQSWYPHYLSGSTFPLPVTDESLPRTSKSELADSRSLPFLRDLIDTARRRTCEEDIIVLTNIDIGIVADGPDKLKSYMDASNLGAAFAWRHNFNEVVPRSTRCTLNGYQDGGVDLVAFRPNWWDKHKDRIPDFVLGCESWDYILRLMIADAHIGRDTGISGLIYHQYHDSFWRQLSNRFSNPGQKHNCRAGQNWFLKRNQSPHSVPYTEDSFTCYA